MHRYKITHKSRNKKLNHNIDRARVHHSIYTASHKNLVELVAILIWRYKRQVNDADNVSNSMVFGEWKEKKILETNQIRKFACGWRQTGDSDKFNIYASLRSIRLLSVPFVTDSIIHR